MMQRTEGVLAVPDPDLEIRGGGGRGPVIQTLRQRGAVSEKSFFGPSGLSLV